MNTKTSLKLALGATFATGIALSAAQALADNPFSAKTLDSGYMQLAENKAGGEMKCGGAKTDDVAKQEAPAAAPAAEEKK